MSRHPSKTTSSLVLRGAFANVLQQLLPFKSITSSRTDPKDTTKEILSFIITGKQEPSENDIIKAFALANKMSSNGQLEVIVLDMSRDEFEKAGLDYEFAKYDPPVSIDRVRVAFIDNWAFSASPYPSKESTGPVYDRVVKLPPIKLLKKKWSIQKGELELTYGFESPLSSTVTGDAVVAIPIQVKSGPRKFTVVQEQDGSGSVIDLSWVFQQGNNETVVNVTTTTTTTNTTTTTTNQMVTPWEVKGEEGKGVDYDKLLTEFGCDPINDELLRRFRKVTGHEPHPWLRRGIFYSHRDLHEVLTTLEKKEPIYLYTGRGPSSEALHFGHLIPFMFTKWLHDVLQCPLVIQLTDDEKFLWKDLDLNETQRLGYENARDIMAVGFDPKRTFLFLNTEYMGHMYPLVCEIQKRVTFNQVRGIFGFTDSDAIGKIAFPAIQAAPSFSRCFPIILNGQPNTRCLIPCAIDQDPYFRMTRDVAKKMHLKGPALIHSKFFPALLGVNSKMSSSGEDAIMVTDDRKTIYQKIKNKAFSGGRETELEQQKLGANLEIDVAYQWLRFFLMDNEKLAEIERRYGNGILKEGEQRMMTMEVKNILVEILVSMAESHQARREALGDEAMREVFSIRSLVGG
jgi:tryptophanyl-tRNA synthetase